MFENHCSAKSDLQLGVGFPKFTVTVRWSQEPIVRADMGISS